jgi:hypothetical protein
LLLVRSATLAAIGTLVMVFVDAAMRRYAWVPFDTPRDAPLVFLHYGSLTNRGVNPYGHYTRPLPLTASESRIAALG